MPKEISARKYMALVFTSTYCFIMVGCTFALIYELLKVDTYVALLASFVLIVREISDAYFKKNRPEEKNGPNA